MRINLPVTQREYLYPADASIVSATDLSGDITYVNETFVRISGYEREELIGQPQSLIRHPDMPREAFRDLWATIRAGQPWSALVKNRRKNGDHYWVRAHVTPVRSAAGKVVGYLSVRTCPSRQAVAEASALYAAMRAAEQAGRPLPYVLRGGRVYAGKRWRRALERLGQLMALRMLAWALLVAAIAGFGAGWPALRPWQPWAALVAGALAACLGWAGLRRLTGKPMLEAIAKARRLAAGELAVDHTAGQADHGSELGRALDQLGVNLRAVVGDVRAGIGVLEASAAQVAADAQELSRRTESQAASLEQASAAMEEFTAVLQQSEQRTGEARQLAVAVAGAAGEGRQATDRVRESMAAIQQSAQQIAEVTTLVDELAFQTNLLALNAAVEAARAGEHGRGFAVVAGEVRALAQRSTAASRDIRRLIEASLGKVGEGIDAVQAAEDRVQAIVQAATRVRALIEELAHAAGEQSAGVQQINAMIMQLDGITQHNAAMVGETSAAVAALRHQAALLEASVALFHLEDRPAVPATTAPEAAAPATAEPAQVSRHR